MKKGNKYLNRFILASTILVLPGLSSTSWGEIPDAAVSNCGFKDQNGILVNTKSLKVPDNEMTKVNLITTKGKKVLREEYPERGKFKTIEQNTFDLRTAEGKAALNGQIDELLNLGLRQKAAKKEIKRLKDENKGDKAKLAALGSKLKDLKVQSEAGPEIGGDIVNGLNELKGLVSELNSSSMNTQCQNRIMSQIAEISNAINNNFSDPIVSEILIDDHFLTGWDSHVNIPGNKPGSVATNIADNGGDLSRKDPPNSPLWIKKDIPQENTRLGFGRKSQEEVIDVSNEVLIYSEPKTGFGTRPGMKVMTQEGKELKVRIKVEASTGPFLSRIGNALGYSTYAIDHAKQITMKFDLKYFTEYNSRSKFGAKVTIPRGEKSISVNEDRQPQWDPFDVIISAKLKNGEVISGGDALKARLFKINTPIDPKNIKTTFESKSNYNEVFAQQIETFTIGPVSLEVIDKDKESSLGAWGWNGLGHADLREARGFTMVAGWLGLHDIRKENTRLMVLNNEGKKELQLRVSDWGSGLGLAQGHLLGFKNERPSEMPTEFVKVIEDKHTGKLKTLITTFKPNQPSLASDRMTYDDSRWGARLIAQLTEKQISDALSVSGYPTDNQRVYKYKLIARRNQMVKELGLDNEFPLLANVDPSTLPVIKSVNLEKGEDENPLFAILTAEEYARMFSAAFMLTPLEQTDKLNQIFRMLKVPETEDQARVMGFTDDEVTLTPQEQMIRNHIAQKFAAAKKMNVDQYPAIIEELKMQYTKIFALFIQTAAKNALKDPSHIKAVVRLFKSQPKSYQQIILDRLPKVVNEAVHAAIIKLIEAHSEPE